MTNPAPVYGNINAGHVGLAGSLLNGFAYKYNTIVNGDINVHSNVNVFTDPISISGGAIPPYWHKNFDGTVESDPGFGNVYGNTCGKVLRLTSNVAAPAWNRLINAKIGSSTLVNCSTDPCDLHGMAIPLESSDGNAGDASSNEMYREQLALKLNTTVSTANISINNPVYIASVSPFGSSLSGTAGVVENMSLHSFTGNFFANLPSDNVIYASGNVLTGLSINGNINATSLSLFSSNVVSTSAPLDGINLNNEPDVKTELEQIVSVELVSGDVNLDSLFNGGEIVDVNGNLTDEGTFQEHDHVIIVHGNLDITPSYLMDRLITSNLSGFVVASNVFSNDGNDVRQSIVGNINSIAAGVSISKYSISPATLESSPGVLETSSKYLYLTGNSIQEENWKLVSNIVAPVAVPFPQGIPDQDKYVTGNVVNIYVQKGNISVSNYTSAANKVNSGDWVKSIPSFMKTFYEPNEYAYVDTNVFSVENTPIINAQTKNINVGTVSNPVNVAVNLTDNLNFDFYGNTDESSRTDNRLGNVVANTSSIMADIWSYNAAGVTVSGSLTEWSPKIVYGDVVPSNNANIVRPLSLSNEFTKENMDYKLEFPSYVGKTTAPSSGNYSFFANITVDGTAADPDETDTTNFDFVDNQAVDDILLDEVVSTTYTIKSNSYKYTDIGTVLAQDVGDSEFNAVLPFAARESDSNTATTNARVTVDDIAMNVIVDYFQNPTLLSTEENYVHRLTIYDIQYRYAITNVTRSGASPLSTKLTIHNSNDLATNLVVNNGSIGSSLNINLTAPEFVLFMYDNVTQYSSSDALYPFLPASTSNLPEDARWFPGFNYRNNKYFSLKGDTDVDFTIDANTLVEQNINFLFQTISSTGNTVSVAKSTDNAFKSIPIRKIQLGVATTGGVTVNPLYGYIVVKVLGETNSYVIILYKLDSAGNDYCSNVINYLPVMVNVKSIELSAVGSKQQVEFKSALRVYDNPTSALLVHTFANTVNSHKSPLSLFNYSSVYGSNDSSVGVNTYSAPPSNTIMQWAYKQSVIKRLVDYEYVNKVLDGMNGYKTLPSQTTGTVLFALTKSNQLDVADTDNHLAEIPASTTRCYLDAGFEKGVYIDIKNSYILTQPIQFSIDRSVEWVLKRKLSSSKSYEVVGRGLLSRESTGTFEQHNYLILENDLTKPTSGFQMDVYTNIIDLSAQLLAQSINTGPLKNGASNELALNISTKVDELLVQSYRVNPISGDIISSSVVDYPISDISSSSKIDLAYILSGDSGTKGQLPSFTLSSVRGYPYASLNNNTNSPIFSISYTPDNYAIIQLWQNGNGSRYENPVTNGVNTDYLNSVFYSEAGVNVNLTCADLGIEFVNVQNQGTLNKNFASLNKADDFYKYASYRHAGFGTISYGIHNFTSHYGKTLPSQYITPNSVTPSFVFKNDDAYKVSTPVSANNSANIEYDSTKNKYYAEIGNDLFYFRGIGLTSLPLEFNNKNTVLLYTGTRPIVVSALTMAVNSDLSDIQPNNIAIPNKTTMFTNSSWLSYSSSAIRKQTYAVFLTNGLQTGSANMRSLKVTPKPKYFTEDGNFYLGAFINSSDILSNNFVNVSYTNGSYRYPFTILGSADSVNPVQSINDVTNDPDLEVHDTFLCKNTELNDLFKVTISKSLPAQLYNISINPATLRIYEAIDSNNNSTLDVNKASGTGTSVDNFGLNNAFSELLYTLTPVVENSKVNVPKVVDSWVLDRLYHNIKGSSLDINMNVKWNVGYNLGNFFTIQQNMVASFDVITVHTEYNSSANNKNMTNLVVSPATRLAIGNKNSWASSNSSTDYLSGLTFKVNTNKKIVAGEIVRLFVDNQVLVNNTLAFAVGNKTYKLSSYDQERYAALLDEQIRFTNNIE